VIPHATCGPSTPWTSPGRRLHGDAEHREPRVSAARRSWVSCPGDPRDGARGSWNSRASSPTGSGGPRPEIEAITSRCHGDYHLGQVLTRQGRRDYRLRRRAAETSFEASTAKRSPLEDVGRDARSSLRVHAALLGQTPAVRLKTSPPWSLGTFLYYRERRLLNGYLAVVGQRAAAADTGRVADPARRNLLEKAIYEISYELTYDRSWVRTPTGNPGLLASPSRCISTEPAGTGAPV